MYHDLKTWPVCFNAIWNGEKTFDVRNNDRDFHNGDELTLLEYDPQFQEYTGRSISAIITYICKLPPPLRDFVGMQIEIRDKTQGRGYKIA